MPAVAAMWTRNAGLALWATCFSIGAAAAAGDWLFLNQLSLALSALVVLAIAAQWVTVGILQPCISSL